MLCVCIISDATELIPSANTTTFLNNGFSVEFTCSGVGLYVNWLVDGQSTRSISITQRGIVVTDLPLIDQNVISKLTIQTTAVNNNTKVQCAVVDTSLNAALSAPVWLSLQGLRLWVDKSNSCSGKKISYASYLECLHHYNHRKHDLKTKQI